MANHADVLKIKTHLMANMQQRGWKMPAGPALDLYVSDAVYDLAEFSPEVIVEAFHRVRQVWIGRRKLPEVEQFRAAAVAIMNERGEAVKIKRGGQIAAGLNNGSSDWMISAAGRYSQNFMQGNAEVTEIMLDGGRGSVIAEVVRVLALRQYRMGSAEPCVVIEPWMAEAFKAKQSAKDILALCRHDDAAA